MSTFRSWLTSARALSCHNTVWSILHYLPSKRPESCCKYCFRQFRSHYRRGLFQSHYSLFCFWLRLSSHHKLLCHFRLDSYAQWIRRLWIYLYSFSSWGSMGEAAFLGSKNQKESQWSNMLWAVRIPLRWNEEKRATTIEVSPNTISKPVWPIYPLEENGHIKTEFGRSRQFCCSYLRTMIFPRQIRFF